ncbi:MAG: hypothetical protein AAF518_13725 [Spirochaetota bacterium]
MYIAEFYQHITGQLSQITGWRLPPAPYFFPDLLVYSSIGFLQHYSLELTIYTYANLQILFLFAICFYLSKQLGLDKPFSFLCLLLSTLLLLPNIFFSYTKLWTVSGIHGGAFLVTLFTLSLSYSILNDKDYSSRKIWLLLLCNFCMGLSDRLYLAEFLVPFLVVLIIRVAIGLNDKRYLKLLVLSYLFPYALGTFMHKRLPFHGAEFYLIRSDSIALQLQRLYRDISNLPPTVSWYFFLVSLALLLLLVQSCYQYYARFRLKKQNSPDTFITFFSVQTFLLFFAVLYSSLYVDIETLKRYFIPTLFLPFLATLYYYTKQVNFRKWFVLALILINVSLFAYQVQHPTKKEWQFYPPVVRCLDRLAKNYIIRFGFSEYWISRQVRLFSKTGISLQPLNTELQPFHWINNIHPYHRHSYNFIHTASFSRQKLIDKFGKPDHIETCGKDRIYIYQQALRLN